MIVAVGALVGILIFYNLKPVNAHLSLRSEVNPFQHFMATLKVPKYQLAFLNTGLLTTGAFMMMPFGTAFAVNNLEIPFQELPMLYLVTGIASMMIGPLIGRSCDRFGKFNTFLFGVCMTIPMVLIYTHMGPSSIWLLILVQTLFFVGIFSRTIPSQALTSALPTPDKRGSFMSLNSSLQQISGGISSMVAGLIVVEGAGGKLDILIR